MYYFYSKLLLQIHKTLQKISCGIYALDKKTKTFISFPHLQKSIKHTHFPLRIYMLLLLSSFVFGVNQYTILQNVLSASFVVSRLGNYYLFLIVVEGDVLQDAITLLNRMRKYEAEILRTHKLTMSTTGNCSNRKVLIFALHFKLF